MENKIIDTNDKNLNYYSQAIKETEKKDFLEFLKWFNGGDNLTEIINSGYKNFYCDILHPIIYQISKARSKKMTALEIGCGGGRILNAASKYFEKVIGVDIHDSFGHLDQFLSIENTNYELYKCVKNKFSEIENNSVDFVYSFIVFQHILKIQTFEDYLKEINRVLKKDAYTIIYFGRPRWLSRKTFRTKLLNILAYWTDKIIYENLFLQLLKNGYFENFKAVVNHVNLEVSRKRVRFLLRKYNLKIKTFGSTRNKNAFGTQYYFIAQK